MEFGTGAVKITPAHDQNDYNTGKRHNLEFINILTDDGLLNEECGPEWQGMKRFDARKKVIEQLKEKNLDPATYAPKATYVQPELLSVGAEQVLVNGKFVVRDGQPTGALPGAGVLHAPTAGSCN